MSLPISISSEYPSILPFHTKRMSISNITTPSLSNKTNFENAPLSSAENSPLSVTSSSSISSFGKESSTSSSPEYSMYSSYDPLLSENQPKLTKNEKKRVLPNITSQFLHQKQEYKKAKFDQYNDRHCATILDYTITHNVPNVFNRGYQESNFTTESPMSEIYPLSLHKRRQRNKVASAKYRAKKNQQHDEMESLISSLTKENELLKRQLNHMKRENDTLKENCDLFRGKLVAEKMLKKFLSQKKHPNSCSRQLGTGAAVKEKDTSEASLILSLKEAEDYAELEKRH